MLNARVRVVIMDDIMCHIVYWTIPYSVILLFGLNYWHAQSWLNCVVSATVSTMFKILNTLRHFGFDYYIHMMKNVIMKYYTSKFSFINHFSRGNCRQWVMGRSNILLKTRISKFRTRKYKKKQLFYFICRNHNLVFSSFMTYHLSS